MVVGMGAWITRIQFSEGQTRLRLNERNRCLRTMLRVRLLIPSMLNSKEDLAAAA